MDMFEFGQKIKLKTCEILRKHRSCMDAQYGNLQKNSLQCGVELKWFAKKIQVNMTILVIIIFSCVFKIAAICTVINLLK